MSSRAARCGPIVCELDGPGPMRNNSLSDFIGGSPFVFSNPSVSQKGENEQGQIRKSAEKPLFAKHLRQGETAYKNETKNVKWMDKNRVLYAIIG